jgi:hypothetical protein
VIFDRSLARLVLDGSKTQTRRPVKRSDGLIVACSYKPGRDYAVQRRRAGRLEQIARIEVQAVEQQRLGTITFAQVRAEGFRTTVEFADHYMLMHDRSWPPTEPCAICGPFDIDEDTCPACQMVGGHGRVPTVTTDEDVMGRFHERHGDRLVWAITFEMRGEPRFLAPSGDGSGLRYRKLPTGRLTVADQADDLDTDLGYATNPGRAMRDEPEAVDTATLARFTADAADRRAGEPGRRAEHARRLMRANQERVKRLLAAEADPSELLAVLEQTDQHLRLLEEQTGKRAA